jgi:hypothetical protein
MKQSKKLNEGIRIAKEGIEECWDDMGGQDMTTGEQGEQMSVTISMPGKNISVTTDSADEIGNILRLAGITLGAEEMPSEMPSEMPGMEEPAVMYVGAEPTVPADQVPGDVDGDGDHDMSDHEAEESDDEESDDEESDDEETREAAGDVSYTDKGGKVTQTATGLSHQAGSGVYGGTETDAEEAARKEKEQELAKKDIPEASDPQLDRYHDLIAQGMDPDEAEEQAYMNDIDDIDESARILQLAGVTNEAQSAAQKAAFKAMIAKKNGGKADDKSDDKADNKKPDADGDGVPDWADKDKEVKEEAPATNSIFGQGVYEQSYARILELAGVAESKLMNSPAGTSMDEPKEFDSLPSGRGTGAGRKDYGSNRANNQGENPMGITDSSKGIEEAFSTAMGEYRKFVAENIARKK